MARIDRMGGIARMPQVRRCLDARSARRSRRARSGGFTLVELLVSMVAGLIVALAVVGLSKEASNTFHEETRIASAEMQIRTAIDRLRADVARASFMSTGNIYIDPQILTTPGTTINVGAINAATYKSTTDMSLYSLAGIRLLDSNLAGGSLTSTPLSAFNGVSPDTIELAGDMTGVEILQIGGVTGTGVPAIEKGVGCGGLGSRIHLNVQSSPAMWRLVGMSPSGTDAAYTQQLLNAFQPVAGSSFIVRVVDNSTHKIQFAATCATTSATEPAAWNATASIPQPYIDLDSDSINLPGVSPNATINPVQIVRWQIQGSLINSPGDASDGNKYDLTRQYVDAKGALTGNPEVVAEYAVDLKFAFTVDNADDATGNYAKSATSPIVVNAFEEGSNATFTNAAVAGDVTTQPSVPLTSTGPQPQRIRSVRIRLVTRTPSQDRSEPLAVTGATDYLYRYCLTANAATCAQAGAPVFARTRTLISEVALPNQARFWYK